MLSVDAGRRKGRRQSPANNKVMEDLLQRCAQQHVISPELQSLNYKHSPR